MNAEFLKALAGSVARWALASFAGYLVSKGVITGEQAETLILAAGVGLFALAWAVAHKYRVRERIQTALALPANSTERDLERAVKAKE